ncbi:MAG: ECF transporter S component, partial [Sphaerochaetaceae bacterium]
MNTMSNVKRSLVAAVCIALGVVLPMAFHSVKNAGSIFCPMHIPVLLCGLVDGWAFGLLCGLVTPLLSSLLTGMPPMAYLPAMMIELAVYGLEAME